MRPLASSAGQQAAGRAPPPPHLIPSQVLLPQLRRQIALASREAISRVERHPVIHGMLSVDPLWLCGPAAETAVSLHSALGSMAAQRSHGPDFHAVCPTTGCLTWSSCKMMMAKHHQARSAADHLSFLGAGGLPLLILNGHDVTTET